MRCLYFNTGKSAPGRSRSGAFRMPHFPARRPGPPAPSLGCFFALFLACLVASTFSAAASGPARPSSPPPDRRELWVPAEALKSVLAKNPKAVLLSREQYELLLRDATAGQKTPPQPPVPAVLTSATYTGAVEQNTLQLHGELQVDVFSDRWTEIPFHFEPNSLGAIKCDGDTALSSLSVTSDAKRNPGPQLLVHGRGTHRIVADFSFPIARHEENFVLITLPGATAGVMTVDLPPNVKVFCNMPFQIKNGPKATSVSIAQPARGSSIRLSWLAAGAQQTGDAVISENGNYRYFINAERIRAELGFELNASLGKLPPIVEIAVPPGARVLEVEGPEVVKWSLVRDHIGVQLAPGDRTATSFNAVLETTSLQQKDRAEIALPVPKVLGIGRVSGVFAIHGSPEVSVRDITPGPLATQMANDVAGNTDFIAAFRFPVQPEPPRVTVAKTTPRFDADLDTLAEFRQDGIFIERTVGLRQREGEIFEATIVLPATEELLSVRTGNGTEPDWRSDKGRVFIRWSERAPAGQPRVFKLRSRSEPEKWTQMPSDGLPVTLGDAVIQGVDKVNGYVALRSDASFRLEKIDAGAMEQRDGRRTPVQGEFAWFRGRDCKLALTVAKRPGELRAAFTGYALPMEDVLDVHGQFDFDALYSGVKTVRIQVPAPLAAQFNFEGPQIAERKLDGDIWSISFQKELAGHYQLSVSVQAPVTRNAADESRFSAEVPRIAPLGVQRTGGTWAIEANTETEISFAAAGMNELDSLLAPPMTGYQPRHRVIGVFQFIGDTHSLKLTAVRHASAPMLTTVIDEMSVDTVVTSGTVARHQARMAVRTSGEQFLQVGLPEHSKLVSLTVDGEPVKPVGLNTNLRVQLPARKDTTSAVRLALLYETPKRQWAGAGTEQLFAPKLSPEIAVLKSQWRVFVPDGYGYRDIESNLASQTKIVTPLLVERFEAWGIAVLGWVARHVILLIALGLVTFCVRVARRVQSWPLRLSAVLGICVTAVVAIFLEGTTVYFSSYVEPSDFSGESQAFGRSSSNPTPDTQMRLFSGQLPPPAMAAPRSFDDITTMTHVPASPVMIKQAQLPSLQPLPVDPNRLGDNREDMAKKLARKEAKRADETKTIRALLETVIPKLELKDATVREAVAFVKSEVSANIVLKLPEEERNGGGSPAAPNPNEARITLSLTNIPAGEALKYIASLAGLKIRIEPYAVTIEPLSVVTDQLITKEFYLGDGFMTGKRSGSGPNVSVPAMRKSAKEFLEGRGIQFPPGASAVFLPSSGKMIIRNTPDMLDQVEEMVGVAPPVPSETTTAGLLPMKLDLPLEGRPLVFQEFYAPVQVKFGYLNWWAQARRGWLWFVTGAGAFLLLGRTRPWRRTLWAVLVLSFYPLCGSASAVWICNALLAGWLVGLALERFAAWAVFREPAEMIEGKAVGV